MKNLLALICISFMVSSCSTLLSDESPELVTEKSCRQTCLMTNKIYIDYDTDFGCQCVDR